MFDNTASETNTCLVFFMKYARSFQVYLWMSGTTIQCLITQTFASSTIMLDLRMRKKAKGILWVQLENFTLYAFQCDN